MEKTKTSKSSKKALRSLISDSLQQSLNTLELPQSSKKAKKLLHRSAKKLAIIFADAMKREEKKKKKAEKFMEDAVTGKGKKKSSKQVKLEKHSELEAI